MTYSIVELVPNKEDNVQPNPSSSIGELLEAICSTLTWDLYVDKSSNNNGCRAGLILSSPKPEHLWIDYTLRLGFKASNNEAKYKVLLTVLRLAQVVGARHLRIFNDSQLMVL